MRSLGLTWMMVLVTWVALGLPIEAAQAQTSDGHTDLNQACTWNGEDAVRHVLGLMQRSKFHGAYADFNRRQNEPEFITAEYRLNHEENPGLSPEAIAQRKASFINEQIRAEVSELAEGFFSQFDPDASKNGSKSLEEFSAEAMEAGSLTPIATLYMAKALLEQLGKEGFRRVSEIGIGAANASSGLEIVASPVPVTGNYQDVPDPLRSRVCLMATHVLVESLELTPLSIVRNLDELQAVMRELEQINPSLARAEPLVRPEFEQRWNSLLGFALDSYRRKFDWVQFLQGVLNEGKRPKYVHAEEEFKIFQNLVKAEIDGIRPLLGLNESGVSDFMAQHFPQAIESSHMAEDQKVLDLWHARMQREIARQTFSGHKLVEQDLWGPFVSKAIEDYPQILPCEMRKDCDESKPEKPVFEAKGRGMKLDYERQFYSQVYLALGELEYPYLMPVLVKIAELNLGRVPEWAMMLLGKEVESDRPMADTDVTQRKEAEKKLDDYFYPQRAALYLLGYNLRWFPNAHLEILKQWCVEQIYALQAQCEANSQCISERGLGVFVNDYLDLLAELHAMTSTIAQSRSDHERAYYQNAWDPSNINDGTLYPLPDLKKEMEPELGNWFEEAMQQEGKGDLAQKVLEEAGEPRSVRKIDYYLNRLESNLTTRDLIYTPMRVIWHLSDHPGQIPILMATLVVFGAITFFWPPFLLLADAIFVTSVAIHLVVNVAHLAGARSEGNQDNPGKYRGLRAAKAKISIANQVMWVVPFVRPIGTRFSTVFRSARRSFGELRDFKRACELLELPYGKPQSITLSSVRGALKEFQLKLHPDRFVKNPQLQAENLAKLEERLKAADFLQNLFTSRGAVLNARITSTEPEALRAYEILRLKPGASIAQIDRRLALREIRIQGLRKLAERTKRDRLAPRIEAKAQELEAQLIQARAARETLLSFAKGMDVAFTGNDVRGRALGILLRRFFTSRTEGKFVPNSDIVETNPLRLSGTESDFSFPVPSIGQIFQNARDAV